MPDSQALHVLQVTDVHLFADKRRRLYGQNTDQSFRAVLSHIRAARRPFDMVILTGDLAEEGERKAYQRLVQTFADWPVPVLALPGNHDASATMRGVFETSNIQFLGHRTLKNWRFILLDSTNSKYREAGYLDDAAFAGLERQLGDDQELPSMICLHHPPMSVGTTWCDEVGLINGRRFLSFLAQFPNVKAVACGHVHQDYQAMHGHIRLFATPSTCVQWRPRAADFEIDPSPPGYRWFRLHPQGDIDTGVVRVPLTGRTGQDL